MFLKCRRRQKDGKEHRSWSIVESRRVGRPVGQRHVLYLGEINDSQRAAWQKSIAVFDEQAGQSRQCALFPEDRLPAADDAAVAPVRLGRLQLSRPRTWGACWLGDQLWRELQLDTFFAPLPGCSREGTDWEKVLRVLTLCRLPAPGSEWRLHRHWFGPTALADLLGVADRLAQADTRDRGLDGLLEHKDALFTHLRRRWSDLFGAKFDVRLYDLTSTYFEGAVPAEEADPRRFGYSRDKRSDCVQVVVALVGTPKGRLTRLEKELAEQPWQAVRPQLRVKLLSQDGEAYVLAERGARTAKERAMRRRRLKALGQRPGEIQQQELTRDRAGRVASGLVKTTVTTEGKLTLTLGRAKLRTVRHREGRCLLRPNLSADKPGERWRCYMQLVAVEEAFRTLKGDLGLRPVYHHKPGRIEAQLFVAFLACCLATTLRQRLKALAGGLMPRVVFEKLATLQLLDVRVPATAGRKLRLIRRTEPDHEVALLLARLKLQLPPQSPPRVSQPNARQGPKCSGDLGARPPQ